MFNYKSIIQEIESRTLPIQNYACWKIIQISRFVSSRRMVTQVELFFGSQTVEFLLMLQRGRKINRKTFFCSTSTKFILHSA
jgi:hypothetical protein